MLAQLLGLQRHLLALTYMEQLAIPYGMETQTPQGEINPPEGYETQPGCVVPGVVRVGLAGAALGVDL